MSYCIRKRNIMIAIIKEFYFKDLPCLFLQKKRPTRNIKHNDDSMVSPEGVPHFFPCKKTNYYYSKKCNTD